MEGRRKAEPAENGNLLVYENQVHCIRVAAIGRETARPLEEVRVAVARNLCVRRVIAIGPKGVGGHVTGRQVGGGLSASVARMGVGVFLNVARDKVGDEGVDASVARENGHGDFFCVVGGAALVDCAVGVEAEFGGGVGKVSSKSMNKEKQKVERKRWGEGGGKTYYSKAPLAMEYGTSGM